MTWEQAMARANTLAARTGLRYRVVRCGDGDAPCPCGEWLVFSVGQPR